METTQSEQRKEKYIKKKRAISTAIILMFDYKSSRMRRERKR